jgi:hypothetical protein
MASKTSSAPDPFSLSPLFAILPEEGSLKRLQSLSSSLFARHEKVESLRSESKSKDMERRFGSEAAMLKQILDWLEVTRPGGE